MLKPLEDYVVLEPLKEERQTESGIILAAEDKEKPQIGRVLSVGPKVENLNKDDRVIYQTYSGTKVKLEGFEYLVIQAKNILAIIE